MPQQTALLLAGISLMELALGVFSASAGDCALSTILLLAGITQGMLAGAIAAFDGDYGRQFSLRKKQSILISMVSAAGVCAFIAGLGHFHTDYSGECCIWGFLSSEMLASGSTGVF